LISLLRRIWVIEIFSFSFVYIFFFLFFHL
jgi:hypothetical protein